MCVCQIYGLVVVLLDFVFILFFWKQRDWGHFGVKYQGLIRQTIHKKNNENTAKKKELKLIKKIKHKKTKWQIQDHCVSELMKSLNDTRREWDDLAHRIKHK